MLTLLVKIMRRRTPGRLAACTLFLLFHTALAAGADEGLAQDALKALDQSLSTALERSMQGQVLYQDEQPMAITIGLDYPLSASDRSADWAERVSGLLREMGAVNVLVSDNEVRGEQLPVAGRKAAVTHFQANAKSLNVTLIFLEL